jgi:hypothetical protein
MSIAITGQYVFRSKTGEGSAPVGMIYPDTTQGMVFASAPGESFTHQERYEIAEFVKNKGFSREHEAFTTFGFLGVKFDGRRAAATNLRLLAFKVPQRTRTSDNVKARIFNGFS